jgi:hypothetical protein
MAPSVLEVKVMRIFAHHDVNGTIRSLVAVDGPEGAGMVRVDTPGTFVSEIDGITLRHTAIHDELRELARSHKLSVAIPRCSLIRK